MELSILGQTITNRRWRIYNDTLNQAIKNALITAGWSLIKSGSGDGIGACARPPRRRACRRHWLWRGSSGTPAPSQLWASSPLATTNASGLLEQAAVTVLTGGRLHLPVGCQRLLLLPVPQRDSDARSAVLLLHGA